MQYDLWDDQLPRQKRNRKPTPLKTTKTYSITGANDCEILGHTLRAWDLAGCTVCLDCGAKIFCPHCTSKHPQDEKAIALLCDRHEQTQESQVSA